MRSRLLGTFQVTIVEGPAVFLWLYFSHEDPISWWLMLLVVGESLESFGIAYQLRGLMPEAEVPDRDGRVLRRRRLTIRFYLASPFEVGIWVVWLMIANEIGQVEAGVVLLVLMHLKHQFEACAIQDTAYTKAFFGRVGLIGSGAEVLGAAICLWLLREGEPVLAGAVLAVGFIVEHALLVNALFREVEHRERTDWDLGLPTRRRPPATLPTRFATVLMQHGRPVWRVVQSIRFLNTWLNRTAIKMLIDRVPPRPNPFSTRSSYTTWASLTDRTWSGLHLEPTRDTQDGRSSAEAVAELFRRPDDRDELCPKSTMLFSGFAQWFVDGFLRTQRDNIKASTVRDTRRNESTHDVDLSQLYGLTPKMLNVLRAWEGGRLDGQPLERGELYPPLLCENQRIKPRYDGILMTPALARLKPGQRDELFAMGTDVRNLGFVAFNVLFLRAHNQIAGQLEQAYGWDDEQLFQTTRMVLTVILLRIVVEDYVNHIVPAYFRFKLPLNQLQRERWQRPNWMAVEFDLLYRWHSLIPRKIILQKHELSVGESLSANVVLREIGLGAYMRASSEQRAGRIQLFNTDPELVVAAETFSVRQGRAARLRPYNDYRQLCGLPRLRHFGEFSKERRVRDELRKIYDTVDDVELFVGLFAEQGGPHDVLPPLMTAMVAFDAFSQILTNPLLSPRIYGPQTFSPRGMELINDLKTIERLIRFVCEDVKRNDFIGFTRQNYTGP
ncbi:hypothetical protein OJ998_00990 [Solirubrobacter taibaiensis]|nr:hypothetical protein [Solirubrobacter taibaiensis]